MFTLLINGHVFESPSYEEFCLDADMWEQIQLVSGFSGTGNDWRYIGLVLHGEYNRQIERNGHTNKWHGIYQPYSVPAFGFKVTD